MFKQNLFIALYREHLEWIRPHAGGVCIRFKFPNGYGADVARHSFSYGSEQGLWETAVMKDDDITYATPITSDVLGFQTEEDVLKTLEAIKSLEAD